jgi:hypothetical protein
VADLIEWFAERFAKERDKRKSDKGKAGVDAQEAELMKFFSAKNKRNLELIYEFQNALIKAKMLIIRKLDEVSATSTFVRTHDGFEVTTPEGYVAIDHSTNGAVKLVDRLTFSRVNFSNSYIKGWN